MAEPLHTHGAALVGHAAVVVPVPATGTVRARVTSANGVPLRGAEVRVRDPNGRENRVVTTDEEAASKSAT